MQSPLFLHGRCSFPPVTTPTTPSYPQILKPCNSCHCLMLHQKPGGRERRFLMPRRSTARPTCCSTPPHANTPHKDANSYQLVLRDGTGRTASPRRSSGYARRAQSERRRRAPCAFCWHTFPAPKSRSTFPGRRAWTPGFHLGQTLPPSSSSRARTAAPPATSTRGSAARLHWGPGLLMFATPPAEHDQRRRGTWPPWPAPQSSP